MRRERMGGECGGEVEPMGNRATEDIAPALIPRLATLTMAGATENGALAPTMTSPSSECSQS